MDSLIAREGYPLSVNVIYGSRFNVSGVDWIGCYIAEITMLMPEDRSDPDGSEYAVDVTGKIKRLYIAFILPPREDCDPNRRKIYGDPVMKSKVNPKIDLVTVKFS